MVVGGQHHALNASPPGKRPSTPFYSRQGGPPELVTMGVQNLVPTVIPSLNYPACSEMLYRLSHPGPILNPIHSPTFTNKKFTQIQNDAKCGIIISC